jgi:hypothetical protein
VAGDHGGPHTRHGPWLLTIEWIADNDVVDGREDCQPRRHDHPGASRLSRLILPIRSDGGQPPREREPKSVMEVNASEP